MATVILYGVFQHVLGWIKPLAIEAFWFGCAIAFVLCVIFCDIGHQAKRLCICFFVAPWSPKARCEYDLHDPFKDGHDDLNSPYHYSDHRCKRCGKEFEI
jgi:hypothetical protein